MIDDIIYSIQEDIRDTFEQVNSWFDTGEDMMKYEPANGGWTIREILEHIALTNHYLLILIRKAAVKALAKEKPDDFATRLNEYKINYDQLGEIAKHGSFAWNRPDHMEPTGKADLQLVQAQLRDQLDACNGYLRELKNGEGIQVTTMMSVNNLGKTDVYHYIIFLARHAQRHLAQMELVQREYQHINVGK